MVGGDVGVPELQGLIVRVLGTFTSSVDGIVSPCVLSIERIPFTDGEIAGSLTSPQGYSLFEKVSNLRSAAQTATRCSPQLTEGSLFRSCPTMFT